MGKRAQDKIDHIMGEAYEKAFKVLETEVKKFMASDPRYVQYAHMVGWGPGFLTADGKSHDSEGNFTTKRGREIMAFCTKFYDDWGAGNERIHATQDPS